MRMNLPSLSSNVSLLLISWMLGLIFASAAIGKLINLPDFLKVVRAFDLFPSSVAPLLAFALIGLELTIAICLVVTPMRLIGALLSCTLLAFFIAIVGYALYRGLNVSCGCFTFLRDRSFSFGLLAQDVVFLSLAGFLARTVLRQNQATSPAT